MGKILEELLLGFLRTLDAVFTYASTDGGATFIGVITLVLGGFIVTAGRRACQKVNKGIVRAASKAYGYNYTSLADIAAAGYELPKMQTITESDGRDFLYYYDKELGEWIRGAEIVTPEMKGMNKAQLYGSALTYARRYTAFMALQLASADDKYFEKQEPGKEEAAPQQVQEARAVMFAPDQEFATHVQMDRIQKLYTPQEIITMCGRNGWKGLSGIPFDKAKAMIEARNKQNDSKGQNT